MQHLAAIWLDIDSKADVNGITVQLYLIQDDIVKVKKLIAYAIQNWNHKLQELVSQQKKYSKQARKEATPPPPSEDDSKLGTSASSQHSETLDSQSLTSTSEFTEVDIPPGLDPYGRAPSMPVRIYDAVEANFKETYYALSAESNQYSVTPGIDADAGEVDKESTKLDVADMMMSQEVEGTSRKDQIKPSSSKSSLKKTGSSDDILDGHKMDRITNIKSRVTNFLGGSSIPNTLKVNYDEHHQLPAGKVPVLIYDDEPSSIIAYTLGSQEYFAKLQEIQASITQRDSTQNKEFKFGKSGEHDMASAESSETDDVQDGRSIFTSSIPADVDKSRTNKQTALVHIQLQFSDSSTKFYCKVYFAEQFRQLRKLIFPDGEEMFIRSLSRCKVWDAKGGKSGSAFCKTHDNRFILKQMSSTEVEIFEKFGFEYFQYISKCYMEQRPTALAKIVGAFRIGFRNNQTNNDLKQDLLVMENLFYNCSISQTFDLKGSMRNRLVNPSKIRRSEQELVLLDENLLKLSVDSPLYVYPHSKTVLNRAIERDSEFLASNFVMDYSLLVGVDETKKELVIGIIDYIRTFTWDKKLETLIKSTGGKQPTVVSPGIYRTRFLEAMERYFLPVPDQWSFLGRDIEY